MTTIEKLIDIINDFFGCDAAYFDVNPYDLATHLIKNGVMILSDSFIIPQISQEEVERLNKLLRECPVSVLPCGEEPNIESIGHEHKWIPVTERLPEGNASVLVYFEYGRNVFWYDKYEGFCDIDAYGEVYPNNTVTHWMPLPEPPKEVL